MMENGSAMQDKDKENKFGQMEHFTKAIGMKIK